MKELICQVQMLEPYHKDYKGSSCWGWGEWGWGRGVLSTYWVPPMCQVENVEDSDFGLPKIKIWSGK